MNIQDVKYVLTASQKVKDSVLMIGYHGIGKTDIVKEWAKENDIYLEVLYLSIQEPADLAGIPYNRVVNDKQIEYWSTPSWLDNMYNASKEGKKCALFLDELSRAQLDVRQTALQLVLDKKIHQHSLPEDTLIIAADNPDNGDYQVEALDPALKDRFLVIDIEIDVKTWLDYANIHNINKIVKSFIVDNPNKLYFKPDEGANDDITATPRSWTKLASYIDIIDNIPREVYYPIIRGKIGSALAAQFLNYMNNFKNLISVQDVEALVDSLKSRKIEDIGKAVKELLKDSEASQKTELCESLVQKYIVQDNVKDAMPMMAILYALDVEILTAFLKNYSSTKPTEYNKISKFDKVLNNKKLFYKLVQKLSFGV